MKYSKLLFPPGIAALLSFETILGADGIDLFGPSQNREEEEAIRAGGGYYERVYYSSRTGRHQGRGAIVLSSQQL